jgi:hypothetical protein
MATRRHPVSPVNRGLPALQKNPLEPGRSERQRPGKLAMGWGPLFLLARTGAGFISAVYEGPGAGPAEWEGMCVFGSRAGQKAGREALAGDNGKTGTGTAGTCTM